MANESIATVFNVSFIRPELVTKLPVYDMIRDCLDGEFAIKSKLDKYLPRPNSADQSQSNKTRYDQYIARAVFYGVTRRTITGLIGQIFLREPTIELPTEIEAMRNDANGETLTLAQLAKQACGYAVPYGRGGLLTDFPNRDVVTTRQQVLEGEIKPTIKCYAPWDIINWKTKIVESTKVLVLLVLQEEYDEPLDEFASEVRKRYRVYSLNDAGECSLRIYLENASEPKGFTLAGEGMILGAEGQPLKGIPFDFIGSENNDSTIDYPPAYDMAVLNLAHYRNSADYEESCFICGQPTPVFTGLTQDWVDNYFKGGVPLGSRSSVPLPEKATAQLLQAEANMLVHESMEQKHKQMVALGARLVEQRKVDRTATEAEIDSASESSVLTDIARNVEKAIVVALQRACKFVNADAAKIKFEVNKNFDLTSLMPEDIRYLIELWRNSALTWSEFRENLRRSGIAKETDADAMSKILSELEFRKKTTPEMIAPQEKGSQPGCSQSKKPKKP